MSTSTNWAARPVPKALSPEQLASWVDRSTSRTEGMLFTATPTDELDAIGRWQQLKDQAFAGQMREIVAAYNRASAQERQFAADEVGLAVGATSTTGGNLVAQALSLAELPGLLEAVEAGQLTERHALAALGELDKVTLTLEQRQAVVLVLLARFNGQAPGELGRLVARLIVQVDRAAAAARDAKATAGRKVWFSPEVDGQAVAVARGPAAAIAAIRASLEATLPDEAEPGDERSRAAREFDLFVELLTGGATAGSWTAEVLIPVSVTEGGELELAEIPGLGPILPATARDLVDQCDTISQTSIDPAGQVIAVSDPTPVRDDIRAALRKMTAAPAAPRALTYRGYRPPTRLRRFLEARDRTCVFPGCRRPARMTDKDHRRPWPTGPTSPDNLDCLCRHHHRAKHAVFTVLRDPDGDYLWITRGGWEFRRHPQGF
ncbi:MAG: hypothetical protein QOE05_2663 [Actinomycetota bacterium]|nr:hypothetical protein [Actinomycetota bacterium]